MKVSNCVVYIPSPSTCLHSIVHALGLCQANTHVGLHQCLDLSIMYLLDVELFRYTPCGLEASHRIMYVCMYVYI